MILWGWSTLPYLELWILVFLVNHGNSWKPQSWSTSSSVPLLNICALYKTQDTSSLSLIMPVCTTYLCLWQPWLKVFNRMVFANINFLIPRLGSWSGCRNVSHLSRHFMTGTSPPFSIYPLHYPKTWSRPVRRELTLSDEIQEVSLQIGNMWWPSGYIYDTGWSCSATNCTIDDYSANSTNVQ